MKILSLFDGISCARVALERAGIPVEAYYASEVDKYAMQISAKNYPDIVQLGDITSLISDEGFSVGISGKGFLENANNIDLLIGGSPCQDLSIAKKDRKGLDGERSGLFWQYVNMLKYVKPKYFILENVNSMPKEAKALITETLGVEPIMINAALVSAQNRKRLFWTNIPNVTLPEDRGILLKDILETEVDEKYFINKEAYDKVSIKKAAKTFASGKKEGAIEFPQGIERKSLCLLASNPQLDRSTNLIRVSQIGKGGQADRIYSPEGKSVGLSALGGGRGAKTGLYMIQTPRGYNKGGIKALDGKTPTLSSSSWEHNNHIIEDTQIRKLTPIECERLQGLEDNYTEGVSNSQRYKMLGNAFNVDVVAHILSFINKTK